MVLFLNYKIYGHFLCVFSVRRAMKEEEKKCCESDSDILVIKELNEKW